MKIVLQTRRILEWDGHFVYAMEHVGLSIIEDQHIKQRKN